MRRFYSILFVLLIIFVLSLEAAAQLGPPRRHDDQAETPGKLPNGKSQQDEILKADHAKDVADARELARLATELKDDVEKGDPFVLSVGELKKTDEIEKLVKRIRGRIRR